MTLAILDARDTEYVLVAAGSELIATYVQQAIAAGETAQDVLDAILAAGLSEGVFASLAAGESGTTDGQYFWVGDGGTVTLYLNDSGTGDEIAELATAAGLAAVEATANSADAAATAAQEAVDTLGTFQGLSGNAPSVIQFPAHNFLHSTASASAVAAGTVDQPNINGGKGYITSFTGDGTTADFVVSPGFIVDNAPYRNILVYLVTLSTRGEVLQSETTHYTVAGKGTGTITITMNTPPTAAQGLRVRVYRKENSAFNPLLNFVTRGYDNFNDGSGSMLVMDGAHHININNPNGHNTFSGGAGNTMRDGVSYGFATGLSHNISASLAPFAAGIRGLLTGQTPAHFGSSGKVGAYSVHFGELGEAETLYSVHFGRRGKTRIAGDRVISAGAAADAEAGMMTIHEYPLRRRLTSASGAAMTPITGSANFAVPINGVCHIWGDFTMTDQAGTDFRVVRLRTSVRRDAGNVVTLAGSHTAAIDQIEILDQPSGFAPATGNWEVQVFGSSTGIFVIQARGAAGTNIQCLGLVRVMYVDPAAASI